MEEERARDQGNINEYISSDCKGIWNKHLARMRSKGYSYGSIGHFLRAKLTGL